jgi:hypothetical protein
MQQAFLFKDETGNTLAAPALPKVEYDFPAVSQKWNGPVLDKGVVFG